VAVDALGNKGTDHIGAARLETGINGINDGINFGELLLGNTDF